MGAMVPDGVLHAVPLVPTDSFAGAAATAMERMTVVLIK